MYCRWWLVNIPGFFSLASIKLNSSLSVSSSTAQSILKGFSQLCTTVPCETTPLNCCFSSHWLSAIFAVTIFYKATQLTFQGRWNYNKGTQWFLVLYLIAGFYSLRLPTAAPVLYWLLTFPPKLKQIGNYVIDKCYCVLLRYRECWYLTV